MDNLKKLKELDKLLEELEVYERTEGKLSFDMECCAPEDGLDLAGEDMAIIGKQIFKLQHSKKYERLVCELHADSEGLSPVQKKLVEHLYNDYRKVKNLSAKFNYESDLIFAKAYGDWLGAKKTGDWSKFAPTLAKAIDITRQSIDLRDEKYPSYYDACLDDYEEGTDIEQMDAFFGALKARIVPLLKRILTEGKPIREDFLTRPCSIPKQEEFSRYLLELEGLKKSALVLMTTEHPFTTNFGPSDVRVTTHYYEENFISNIFTTMHEGGHALFMQNEPEEFYREHVADRMSNGMHECISRFYENLICRSEDFIHFVYPRMQEITEGIFADVSERELFEAVNIAKPICNRCDSDELTYSLHILIRYELEKAFMNGEITVDDIPALWNAKYKEYLGIDVPNDTEGCLQDVHWSGSYGYFPSYALGNAYGAQILHTMQKDFDVYAAVREGKLEQILDWLKKNVFSIASVSTPAEWLKVITGETLNPDYYLDYLEQKFTALYELN